MPQSARKGWPVAQCPRVPTFSLVACPGFRAAAPQSIGSLSDLGWDTGTLGHWDTGTLGHWDTGSAWLALELARWGTVCRGE